MKISIKISIMFLATFFVCGCVASSPKRPWVTHEFKNEATGKYEKVLYSEYFDYKTKILNDKVLLHFMATMGKERLPQQAKINSYFAPNGHLDGAAYRDGIIELVSEIYFTNLSQESVNFKANSLIVSQKSSIYQEESIEIQIGKFKKSSAIWEAVSIYATEVPFTFSYSIDGQNFEVKGSAKRVPVNKIGKH